MEASFAAGQADDDALIQFRAPDGEYDLRVTSGALFIAHGLLKVNVFTVAGTVGYFERLGLRAQGARPAANGSEGLW